MTFIAKDLLARLTHLTLVGIDDEGQMEWVGTDEQWRKVIQTEYE